GPPQHVPVEEEDPHIPPPPLLPLGPEETEMDRPSLPRPGAAAGRSMDRPSLPRPTAAVVADEGWPLYCPSRMNQRQLYRMRAPASGREALAHAEPGSVYLDRETGEEMEPVAMVLPLAPSDSALPRT